MHLDEAKSRLVFTLRLVLKVKFLLIKAANSLIKKQKIRQV